MNLFVIGNLGLVLSIYINMKFSEKKLFPDTIKFLKISRLI